MWKTGDSAENAGGSLFKTLIVFGIVFIAAVF